jgi:prephenate dehydrogenase
MRVGIVGLGLMGASLARALHAARPGIELIGTDTDPATLRRAIAGGLVRSGDPGASDVLVLATPIPALEHILGHLVGCGAVVTDMASTKVRVMEWADAAGVDLVGGHPMCGREQSGLDAADPYMFQGAPWVLTRDERVVTELVRAVGAIPVFMDAAQHDRLVASVSHAAFALSAAYVLALASSPDWPEMKQIAGPGFRDLSRLAAGDPDLYAAIAATNRENLVKTLHEVEASLARLRRRIEDDEPGLPDTFRKARLARGEWAADHGELRD